MKAKQKLLLGVLALTPTYTVWAQEIYTYDDLGRLIQVQYEDGQLAKFQYDAAGNRTLVQMGGAPNLQNDAVNAAEDTPVDIDVLDNDSDLNGDPLSITDPGSPNNGSTEIIDVAGEDWIRYTPSLNFAGVDTFTYTASDGTTPATAVVTVTVVNSNDQPIANNDSTTVNEDSAVTFDPRINDTDPDGQTLTIVGPQDNGASGTVEILSGGTQLRYTPNPNFSGSDSFSYTITDGVLTDSATVSVTVNPVNDAPTANNDSLSTAEDTAKTIDPRVNDTDPEGDSLTVSSKTNGAKGVVSIVNNNTSVRYTPNTNENGSDSFTYTISDGNGGTDTATVNVSISASDDPPNAVNDTKSTNEDTVLTFDPRTNDIEPDGEAITITAKTNGSKGAVAIVNSGTRLRYTPNANQNGSDSFTYTISDGASTDTATVSMTINPVNDAPNAVNDSYSNINPTVWTTLYVLSNDTDIEGGLYVSNVYPVGLGEVQIINGGAAVRYRWLSPSSTTGEFSYQIKDSGGASDIASVTVSISGGGGGLPPF